MLVLTVSCFFLLLFNCLAGWLDLPLVARCSTFRTSFSLDDEWQQSLTGSCLTATLWLDDLDPSEGISSSLDDGVDECWYSISDPEWLDISVSSRSASCSSDDEWWSLPDPVWLENSISLDKRSFEGSTFSGSTSGSVDDEEQWSLSDPGWLGKTIS